MAGNNGEGNLRTDATARPEGAPAGEGSGPFLSVRLDGARARLLIGFASFVAWVNLLVCFEGFLRDTVAYGGGVVRDPLFVAAMLVAGAVLVAVALRGSRELAAEQSPAQRRRLARGLAGAGALGSAAGGVGVALAASAASNTAAVWATATVLGCAAGLFVAAYTLAWGSVIAAFDMREILVVLCVALCLQWVPFVGVVLIGALGKAVLAVGLPALSWWCLRGFADELARARTAPEQRRGRPADADGRAPGRDFVTGRMAAALFCFAFVVQFVWTCNIVMGGEPLSEGLFWLVYVCVLVVSALAMATILGLMERWRSYRMELFYRTAFAFGVLGSVALPLAYNHLFFSYAVIYVAFALISATMWMLAWSVAFMRKVAPRRIIGCVFGLQYLALPCGFAAAKLMQWWAGAAASSALLPYVGFAAVAVLVAAYVFVLPERTLLLLSPRLLKLSHESLDERCRDVARAFGLTEREGEIFALLARGRDVGYIEQELFISRNTVNTHRKNLYRKLGIHTQQELLSLIEDELS
ncbi:helix-turn-helix transcriptional regulator [uncultured Adlercreutzia sp.]|uniref:helix-turn-helix domain-containing protein n=1 Tax=uncultured Adlercreutzia sp. TaxID=875803 RepID=UPI002676C411|nr:helix-turn-helix transcriptional regulator [uncultured Adlercreutzia sp.]